MHPYMGTNGLTFVSGAIDTHINGIGNMTDAHARYTQMQPRSPSKTKPARKSKIPAALREQVWLQSCGRVYEMKCRIEWCNNTMTVHDFHCGHNVPECRGGKTLLNNLVPICARCNLSMGSTYTIDEWSTFSRSIERVPGSHRTWFGCIVPWTMRSSKPK